jgi:ubiquinone/menaquinone biosynthesis C-methylase UbiE
MMTRALEAERSLRSGIMVAAWGANSRAIGMYKQVLERNVRPGMTILHAGCGWDKHDVSRPYRDTCRVVGVDLDPGVEARFHSEFHLAPLSEMPFRPETFDVIACEYVLEHVQDPPAAFAEMRRVLRPGGRIVVLTPNLFSYKSLIARLTPHEFHHIVGRVRYGAGHEEDMYPTVFRCNTARRLRRVARATGFEVGPIRFVSNGPTWFQRFPVVFEIFHLYHLVIARWSFARQLRCALLAELRKPVSATASLSGAASAARA